MPGKVILIAGGRGTGKTTLLKQILKPVNKNALLLYDPAQQHKELYNGKFIPFSEFTEKITKVSNAVIGVEESTIYLSNRGYDSNIVDLLVQSNQRGNAVILIYHSLASLPVYIYNLADAIYLKKTNDIERKIDSRFDSEPLIKAFKSLQKTSDKYATIYVPINQI